MLQTGSESHSTLHVESKHRLSCPGLCRQVFVLDTYTDVYTFRLNVILTAVLVTASISLVAGAMLSCARLVASLLALGSVIPSPTCHPPLELASVVVRTYLRARCDAQPCNVSKCV